MEELIEPSEAERKVELSYLGRLQKVAEDRQREESEKAKITRLKDLAEIRNELQKLLDHNAQVPELEFMERDEFVIDLKKPYLGFCLGCQLLGEVVGGKVVKSNKPEIGMLDINFSQDKSLDPLFSEFPNKITSLQWHSYEVQGLENNKNIIHLASSPETKYQIFKYQSHAYGIQFHIEVKDTTVNDWGCVPEYKSALEKQLGPNALEKFDNEAQANMKNMNNYSYILYSKFKSDILKIQ